MVYIQLCLKKNQIALELFHLYKMVLALKLMIQIKLRSPFVIKSYTLFLKSFEIWNLKSRKWVTGIYHYNLVKFCFSTGGMNMCMVIQGWKNLIVSLCVQWSDWNLNEIHCEINKNHNLCTVLELLTPDINKVM